MDTLIINEGDNTFLVPTEIVGELMEVTLNNGNYSCECNKLTPWENECDHIKQVINNKMDYIPESDTAFEMADIDRLLLRVKAIDEIEQDITTSSEKQLCSIKLWTEIRMSRLNKQRDYYLVYLRAYLESRNKRTEKLVNGTISLRKLQPQLIIEDEEKVLSQGEFVRTKSVTSIDKKSIRNSIKATGVLPDGIDLVEQADKLSYKLEN